MLQSFSVNYSSFSQSGAAHPNIQETWTILRPADDASGLQARWGTITLRSSSDVDLSTRAVSTSNNDRTIWDLLLPDRARARGKGPHSDGR